MPKSMPKIKTRPTITTVEILEPFETITHKFGDDYVGKKVQTDPQFAEAWIDDGYAKPANPETEKAVADAKKSRKRRTKAKGNGSRPAAETADDAGDFMTPEELKGTDDPVDLLALCNERGIEASESDSVTILKAKLTGNA